MKNFVFLLLPISLFSQEIPLKQSNLNQYIDEAYGEKAFELIYSNSKQLDQKRKLLNRIYIINDVSEVLPDYIDFTSLYVINTYNKNLKQKHPDTLNANSLNPFLYKMNVYSKKPVFYFLQKTNQLLKIYPKSEVK